MRISFKVPGVPQGKGRPRFVRATGQTYTPPETKQYEKKVQESFLSSRSAGDGRDAIESAFSAFIVAYFPIPKATPKKTRAVWGEEHTPFLHKPDADNIAKIILDSLNGLLYKDDSLVADMTVLKRYSENPRVEVEIETIEG